MSKLGRATPVLLSTLGLSLVSGCSPKMYREQADKVAGNIITQKQQETLGRTEAFTIEKPSDTLRRRLMLTQNLPHEADASLNSRDLKPIKHWPKDNYLNPTTLPTDTYADRVTPGQPLRLSLLDALQVAAHNSREYQTRKEAIFQDALSLDLARDEFRTIFSGGVDATALRDVSGDKGVTAVGASPSLSASQKLASGATISAKIAMDLVKLLTGDRSASRGLLADVSVTMPLLRGAGEYVVMEPLTQAERVVAYDLLNFEQYKRTFAVSIASQYLSVVQQYDILQNADDAYRRLIVSTKRSRALADAGRLPPYQLDQSLSDELSARDRWIGAQSSCARAVDSFKILLGLPPDANVELDREELQRLTKATEAMLHVVPATQEAASPRPVTQPISNEELARQLETMPKPSELVLEKPDPKEAGPFELPELEAIHLALKSRPDLVVARGDVFDAQRLVTVAANALEAGLTLTGSGVAGSGRSLGSTASPDAEIRPEKGTYTAGLALDLPLHRTAERNAYRSSYITLEKAVRAYQAAEDDIKLNIRNRLRELLEAREGVKTQSQATVVAQRRVDSTRLLFEAGRVQVRDVLDADASLTLAKNALTSAMVEYRVAELAIERDLGLLQVDADGLWREFNPKERRHD